MGGGSQPCCCCDCTCANCNGSGAPCCFAVKIEGLVVADPVSCAEADCLALNRTYFLKQDSPNGCTWSCSFLNTDCAVDKITLEVIEDAGPPATYQIRVEMEESGVMHWQWEKDYSTTKPKCCDLQGVTIPLTDGSGEDCDAGSATCKIYADPPECPCGCTECDPQDSPDCIEVAIAGVVLKSGQSAFNQCADCWNGTYHLERNRHDPCKWLAWIACDDWPEYYSSIEAEIYQDGSDYKLQVTVDQPGAIFRHNFSTTKPDCSAWSSRSLSFVSQYASDPCDWSSATCSVTADDGADCSPRELGPCFHWCDDCGAVPDSVQVVISGTQNWGVGWWCPNCEDLDGTYILTLVSEVLHPEPYRQRKRWVLEGSPVICQEPGYTCSGLILTLENELDTSNGKLTLVMNSHSSYFEEPLIATRTGITAPENCNGWSNYEPFTSIQSWWAYYSWYVCDVSDVTIKLTAL